MSRKQELQIQLPMKLDQSQTYKDLIHCTYSAIFLKLMEQKLLYKMNLKSIDINKLIKQCNQKL